MLHLHPMRPKFAAIAACAWLAWSGPVSGQVGPEESAKLVRPADGLKSTLWASEPMVVNPTNMDVDSRGRVWISEGLNYRLSRPANKKFPRGDGHDQIKILEDTDGDGKADKVIVFAENIFPVPMGLAVEENRDKTGKYLGCRVYVGNSPDLLVLEDTDGDDKADKRSALLTGFGGVDSDHGVHGMVLGIDGKLYFTHGDGCCSVQPDRKSEKTENFNVVDKSGRRVSSTNLANTLRVNRDGTQLEIVCDRQRNNYETSLNSFGNIFTSDNDDDGNRGCRVIWAMDGGHYGYRTPGSPRHWGEDVPGNVPKLVGTGNGSPCGITVYEGDGLGPAFRGGIFEADAGTRQINWFPVVRKDSAFRTEAKVLVASTDPWFRPVDMTAAPDGSVFVADWYDSAVGGHSFRDQTTGRIYRMTPEGAEPKSVKFDFGSVPGLIAALGSANIAAQDAARRVLIERSKDEDEVKAQLGTLAVHGKDPVLRARALWVWHAVGGDPVAMICLRDADPQIREQAVRILGRDLGSVGQVEYNAPAAPTAPPAIQHLEIIEGMADDADPGVRREIILALRNVSTDKAGAALKKLARGWDGRDRWYLEALGLALETRESDYVAGLFDGTLFGPLDPAADAKLSPSALPPYFPVDRNEAYLGLNDELPPANALSKTLGLAWRLHRPEVLPFLAKVAPALATPAWQQASDDILVQINDPSAAATLAGLARQGDDPLRRRQLLGILARKLEGGWRDARGIPQVAEAIDAAMNDPASMAEGIAIAAATGDARYGPRLMGIALDGKAPEPARVAAVEGIGRLKPAAPDNVLDKLIGDAKTAGRSDAVAEAAIRTLPKVQDARDRLTGMIGSPEFPLGLRREALRTFAGLADGGPALIALAKGGKISDDLKTEATTIASTHPDRAIREAAAAVLPLPSTAGGRPLPPFTELVRSRGDAEKGRAVFYREAANACSACHRAQGRGQWVGPDLSTIGTKYGKAELIRSILNPSEAIGYNYRTQVVALADGTVLSGLTVEETPDRLVLKTPEGRRVTARAADIADRKASEVSLMPEGLAGTMSDGEFVDLIAYLETLRRPSSIVGRYEATGPSAGERPEQASWRRLDADAEGQVDLTPIAGADPSRAAFLRVPVTSPEEQDARLVLDTRSEARVWLDGKEVQFAASTGDPTRFAAVRLPKGTAELLIRVPGGPSPTLVTTFVANAPVEFSTQVGSKLSSR